MLKHIHVMAAVLTIFGFILRGCWSVRGSTYLSLKLTKIMPHVIDTILFASGVVMLFWANYSPINHPWVAVKLLAVLLYIINGFYVLKWAKTTRQKLFGIVIAILLFIYIVHLAVFKTILFI